MVLWKTSLNKNSGKVGERKRRVPLVVTTGRTTQTLKIMRVDAFPFHLSVKDSWEFLGNGP